MIELKKYKDNLLFIPLGGSNEIGMNLNVYVSDEKILLVDMGIGFANDFLPGVDVMVPDISFLVENKDKILGLIITHAHEDHIGALPYLWNLLRCPIYSTPFTLSFAQHKMSREGISFKGFLNEVDLSKPLELGPFSVDFIHITHSIPEMHGLVINASGKKVMHTGDWKFDDEPGVGQNTDYAGLESLKTQKIDALVCDSTNVFVDGEAGSEGSVKEGLIDLIKTLKGRVFVTTFASNIARVESIYAAAEASGRKVFLSGASLWRMTAAAQDVGYLEGKTFLELDEIKGYSDEEILIICTGSQGESLASLSKMVQNNHHKIKIKPGDNVVFSSRKIPGNEVKIGWLQNQLTLRGIKVHVDKKSSIHVSGHPAKDDLQRMYDFIKPDCLIPVHGEAMHINEHARWGAECGIKNSVKPQNGDVIKIDGENTARVEFMPTEYIVLDGKRLVLSTDKMFSDRRKLREAGIVMIALFLDKDHTLMKDPIVSARGVIDENEGEVLEEIKDSIIYHIEQNFVKKRKFNEDKIRGIARKILKGNGVTAKTVIELMRG